MKLEENLNFFLLWISHHFIELYELFLKMFAVLGYEMAFHKIIDGKQKKNLLLNKFTLNNSYLILIIIIRYPKVNGI